MIVKFTTRKGHAGPAVVPEALHNLSWRNPRASTHEFDSARVLRDDSTFEVRLIEQLLNAHVLHPPVVEQAF